MDYKWIKLKSLFLGWIQPYLLKKIKDHDFIIIQDLNSKNNVLHGEVSGLRIKTSVQECKISSLAQEITALNLFINSNLVQLIRDYEGEEAVQAFEKKLRKHEEEMKKYKLF